MPDVIARLQQIQLRLRLAPSHRVAHSAPPWHPTSWIYAAGKEKKGKWKRNGMGKERKREMARKYPDLLMQSDANGPAP